MRGTFFTRRWLTGVGATAARRGGLFKRSAGFALSVGAGACGYAASSPAEALASPPRVNKEVQELQFSVNAAVAASLVCFHVGPAGHFAP